MTLRCILLDDEIPSLRYLRGLCEQFPDVEIVRAFNDPSKFLALQDELEYDLCIMDIEMPGMNGIELAQKLRGKAIIFTTAYKNYAADAFELEAIDYIVKPIQAQRLRKALDKAIQTLKNRNTGPDFVQLNSNKGKILLHFQPIFYISSSEIDKRDKLVVMEGGEEVTLKNISFDQLLELLPPGEFVRINRQMILAKRMILSHTYDLVLTIAKDNDGKPIRFSLSENYRKGFLEQLRGD